MKIVDYTMEDARNCADLIALMTHTNKLIDCLKVAGIQVQGSSATNKEKVLAWVKVLATQMANDIATNEAAKSVAPKAPVASKANPAIPKKQNKKARK